MPWPNSHLDCPQSVVPDIYGCLAIGGVSFYGSLDETNEGRRVLSSTLLQHPLAQAAGAIRHLEGLLDFLDATKIRFDHEDAVQVVLCSL
jgi:hypothetical protein